MIKVLTTLVISLVIVRAVKAELIFQKQVSPELKAQVLSDIDFIKSLNADPNLPKNPATPLHQKIFGNLDGVNYETWLKDRVKQIGRDECGGGESVTACVIPFFSQNTLWITSNYIRFSMPTLVRASIILHEARHTETANKNWPHEECPTPFLDEKGDAVKGYFSGVLLEGKPACDKTSFGSYGSQVVWYYNLKKSCKSCSEKVLLDAEIFGADTMKRMIDKKVKLELKNDLGL